MAMQKSCSPKRGAARAALPKRAKPSTRSWLRRGAPPGLAPWRSGSRRRPFRNMDIDARMASVMGGTQVAFDVRTAAIAITSLAAFGALFLVAQRAIDAADHFAPPTLTDPKVDPLPDAAADIADVYLFYTDTDLVLALTFSGPQGTGQIGSTNV